MVLHGLTGAKACHIMIYKDLTREKAEYSAITEVRYKTSQQHVLTLKKNSYFL